MSYKNFYDRAKDELNHFLENSVSNYSKSRNFDYGPLDRNNTSVLSKYISHGILKEYYIVKKTLEKFKLNDVDKFIQEIFWRVYWKGWLENRDTVWYDFINNHDEKSNFYYKAIEGKTNIKCFDEWVVELKKYNYLHNHTRMWFASIWIFTLKLPWRLGAKFFLKHLLDGDAASNTLSWRWVAGLQTRGKHYLAKSWNIEKFTDGKFVSQKLNENEPPLIEESNYPLNNLDLNKNFEKKSNFLTIFENNLSLSDKKFLESYDKVFILFVGNKLRRITLSENVVNFKMELIKDFKESLPNSQFIHVEKLNDLTFPSDEIDVIYPQVGENLFFLKQFFKIKVNFIYNKEDLFCWQYSKKGFFNFKKNISNIITNLDLNKKL